MESSEILFKLKSSLLEFSLAKCIDSLVHSFALDTSLKFADYGLPSIRFELFNLYKIVKDRQYGRFKAPIDFLVDFQLNFPTILPGKLYIRVLTSLKVLYILDMLRSKQFNMAKYIIKEYFPEQDECAETIKINKKILKLRLQWNEMILNEKMRLNYFEKIFHIEYDEAFLKFLLTKIMIIIDTVNAHLPPTQIEQVSKL